MSAAGTRLMGTNDRLSVVNELRYLQAAAFDYRLSRGDVAVYAAILKHCDANGTSFPGHPSIARLANLAVANVKVSIRKLRDIGYLSYSTTGYRKSNLYTIGEPPEVPTKLAGKPSQLAATQLASVPSGTTETRSTGLAEPPTTGLAGIHSLGLPASYELASELTSELTEQAHSDSPCESHSPAEPVSRKSPKRKKSALTYAEWDKIRDGAQADRVNRLLENYADSIQLSDDFLGLFVAWAMDHFPTATDKKGQLKRQPDWPMTILNYLKHGWHPLWAARNGELFLTTAGEQLRRRIESENT